MNCDGIAIIKENNNSTFSSFKFSHDSITNDHSINSLSLTSPPQPIFPPKGTHQHQSKINRFKTIKKSSKIQRKRIKVEAQLFDCAHKSCIKNFRSKKQLMSHHDRLELDCLYERGLLIKLLKAFNQSIVLLNKDCNDSRNKSRPYSLLMRQIARMKKRMANKEKFACLIDQMTKL